MRRPGPPRDIPPPLELECLKALWSLGEGRGRDVRRAMAANRNLAYTTVMTVLDRLEKRGRVIRRKQGRSYIYTPGVSREALRHLAVKELAEGFFDGSVEKLREYLAAPVPPADLPVAEHGEGMEAALL
jgi:predicted transcriptional regulator